MSINKQEEIKKLREQGFNLFPLPHESKIPNLEWKKWQTEKCDLIIPISSNYAVICGYNNLVVVDCDNAELFKDFEEYTGKTLVVKTSKGYHFYFKHNNSKLPNTIHDLKNDKGQKIDVQSAGAFVVGPGSIHPDTKKEYEIISNRPVLEIDFHLVTKKIEQLGFNIDSSKKPIPEIVKGVNEGNRNDSAFKFACYLLDTKKLDENTAMYELNQWNQTNKPPLPESELKTVFESALKQIRNNQKNRKSIPKIKYEKISAIDEELKEENTLQNLIRIEDPSLVGTKIKVAAIVASNSISYSVPSKILGECVSKDNHNCIREFSYTLADDEKASFADVHESQRKSICEKLITENSSFGNRCNIKVSESEHITIKKMRIRPIVSTLEKKNGKLIDEEGNEWKAYDIYLNQTSVQSHEAGKEIEITGIIIPDPKSQKISLVASKAIPKETRGYNTEKVKVLKDFFQSMSLDESIFWIISEFGNYSKIIGRKNIILATFFTFFSPLYFEFDGKIIPGWAKSTIIGDTTTGKSEIVKQAIRLLQAGQIVSGETASIAGLGATATQSTNNQWFVEWGPLVLQDRKLLAIDGAHKLNRNTWAELAESEREGKIRITKAAKGEAYAQTRQIKIMNPLGEDLRTTRPMASFFYPCQSIVNNFQIQNIARQDFAVFVIDDIKAEARNKKNETKADEKLSYLADLVKFVWKQNYDIVFEDEAINEILTKATELENKFKFDEIPLITNDEKYKLAKLSASVAAITCSFNEDFSKLFVKKEHVDYVSRLKDTEYHNAGLDVLASKMVSNEIDEKTIEDLTTDIQTILSGKGLEVHGNFCNDLLLWIAQQSSFTGDQLAAQFQLSRDKQRKPLTAYLQNEGIIEQTRSFRPTRKGIEIGKFLKNLKN